MAQRRGVANVHARASLVHVQRIFLDFHFFVLVIVSSLRLHRYASPWMPSSEIVRVQGTTSTTARKSYDQLVNTSSRPHSTYTYLRLTNQNIKSKKQIIIVRDDAKLAQLSKNRGVKSTLI